VVTMLIMLMLLVNMIDEIRKYVAGLHMYTLFFGRSA
jgi:hypothetical protein